MPCVCVCGGGGGGLSYSTVFQSYLANVRVIMKGSVQWTEVYLKRVAKLGLLDQHTFSSEISF